jgi:hypothetical protein
MADIEQVPGNLNITRMTQGEAFAFQTIHIGNISGDSFSAIIESNGNYIPIGLAISYSGSTNKTTITYTITAEQSASLDNGTWYWSMVQTSHGIARTILSGTWGCYS